MQGCRQARDTTGAFARCVCVRCVVMVRCKAGCVPGCWCTYSLTLPHTCWWCCYRSIVHTHDTTGAHPAAAVCDQPAGSGHCSHAPHNRTSAGESYARLNTWGSVWQYAIALPALDHSSCCANQTVLSLRPPTKNARGASTPGSTTTTTCLLTCMCVSVALLSCIHAL